jgi:hypothetical protein
LPDGWYIFIPKYTKQFGHVLEGLGMEHGTFYGDLVYFTAIWYILRPFGIFNGDLVLPIGTFYGHFVYFKANWYFLQRFGIFYGDFVNYMNIWHIFSRFGIFYQEKSVNPDFRRAVNLFRRLNKMNRVELGRTVSERDDREKKVKLTRG